MHPSLFPWLQVVEVIQQHSEELKERRYGFPLGKLMGGVNGAKVYACTVLSLFPGHMRNSLQATSMSSNCYSIARKLAAPIKFQSIIE